MWVVVTSHLLRGVVSIAHERGTEPCLVAGIQSLPLFGCHHIINTTTVALIFSEDLCWLKFHQSSLEIFATIKCTAFKNSSLGEKQVAEPENDMWKSHIRLCHAAAFDFLFKILVLWSENTLKLGNHCINCSAAFFFFWCYNGFGAFGARSAWRASEGEAVPALMPPV